jgi:hypothetical protein
MRLPLFMPHIFLRIYKKSILVFCLPFFLLPFFKKRIGEQYHVGFYKKIKLLFQMIRNVRTIPTASHFLEHLVMVTKILSIPASQEGVIIECGSYKGGSTATLSLVSALCKRQLYIFDSFEGLPFIQKRDKKHLLFNVHEIHSYTEAEWRGSLQEVQRNILKYGNLSVCNFQKGYFNKTLPIFKKKVVFIFVDVDLTDSLETCLKWLWPLLQEQCYFFTHEANHMEIASVFFDKEWWYTHFHSDPPGLVGAGNGVGLFPQKSFFGSPLGYTIKNPEVYLFKEISQKG